MVLKLKTRAFINALANALPQMMGNETRQPLWPSLENVLGDDYFKQTNVNTCWETFFDSGSEWATEFKTEIARIKELRAQAIVAARREATPMRSSISPITASAFAWRSYIGSCLPRFTTTKPKRPVYVQRNCRPTTHGKLL